MSNQISLRSFNLNTLPILREILRHGSVGKAAIALNVSQPALSGALKQLRQQFGDELIVRTKGSMKLTAKAESMLAPLEQALAAVQQILTPSAQDPMAPPKVMTIATNDHVMNILGAPLVHLLLQEKLNILPHFLVAGGHTPAQLIDGTIDCIILPRLIMVGSHTSTRDFDALNSELLFSEDLVGIGRREDTELANGLSLEEYLKRPHVTFSVDFERNLSVEQAFLAGNSLKQNDIVRFSSYSALLAAVASTGCIGLVPRSLARFAEALFNLQIFVPPLAFPQLEWTLIWHRRADDDQRLVQCRTILKACALQVMDNAPLVGA